MDHFVLCFVLLQWFYILGCRQLFHTIAIDLRAVITMPAQKKNATKKVASAGSRAPLLQNALRHATTTTMLL